MNDEFSHKSGNTIEFSLNQSKEEEMKRILLLVYDALKEKGYHVYHHPQQRPQPGAPHRSGRTAQGRGALLSGRVIPRNTQRKEA